ncbi:MAG: hypothetical protein AAF587_33130 [Bacteroidota bacterium]
MKQELKALLRQLREEVPIGIQEGIALLRAHDGDIDKVKELWMKQVLDDIVGETQAPRETAKIYFVGLLFDKKEAIKRLKELGFEGDKNS